MWYVLTSPNMIFVSRQGLKIHNLYNQLLSNIYAIFIWYNMIFDFVLFSRQEWKIDNVLKRLRNIRLSSLMLLFNTSQITYRQLMHTYTSCIHNDLLCHTDMTWDLWRIDKPI